MIVVYWLEWPQPDAPLARHVNFDAGSLAEALRLAENLRRRRREGEAISHVVIQSEMAESVGEAGVLDAPSDYAHYKRRLDPSFPLGRPSGHSPADDEGGSGGGSP